MPPRLSWSNLQIGLVTVEQLVPILDYAMQLLIDTDGKAGTVLIDLTGPQAAFKAKVEDHAKQHADELRPGELRCTKCGLASPRWPRYETCRTQRGVPLRPCGGHLELRLFEVSEDYLRDRASPLVCKAEPILNRQAWVSGWVVHGMYAGRRAPAEVRQPLKNVLRHVADMIAERVGRLRFHLPTIAEPAWLGGRRDLLPNGDSLREKHGDYVAVRQALVSLHEHLAGLTVDHPEFVELQQQHDRPPTLPPAARLPEKLARHSGQEKDRHRPRATTTDMKLLLVAALRKWHKWDTGKFNYEPATQAQLANLMGSDVGQWGVSRAMRSLLGRRDPMRRYRAMCKSETIGGFLARDEEGGQEPVAVDEE